MAKLHVNKRGLLPTWKSLQSKQALAMYCMNTLWSSEVASLHQETVNIYSTQYFIGNFDLMTQKDN